MPPPELSLAAASSSIAFIQPSSSELSTSSAASFASFIAQADSASTRFRDSGESRTMAITNEEMVSAIIAGAHTPYRQPNFNAAVPARRGARKAPKLWEMFL